MILDCHARPLRRTIGFIRGYEPVLKTALIGALYVVGVEAPPVEEDDGEEDAARTLERMRRAA